MQLTAPKVFQIVLGCTSFFLGSVVCVKKWRDPVVGSRLMMPLGKHCKFAFDCQTISIYGNDDDLYSKRMAPEEEGNFLTALRKVLGDNRQMEGLDISDIVFEPSGNASLENFERIPLHGVKNIAFYRVNPRFVEWIVS